MNPIDFVKTIYLGDRACKKIILDSWNKILKIQVDSISRIRSSSGQWEFYTDEDLDDGYIVFNNLYSFKMEPPGPIPNDYINDLSVKSSNSNDYFEFEISISSVHENFYSSEVVIKITAKDIQIESADGEIFSS